MVTLPGSWITENNIQAMPLNTLDFQQDGISAVTGQ